MSILRRKTGRRGSTIRNHFWELLLISVYYRCPSAVPFDLPWQKLPVAVMFVPALLREGGHSLTCWLTWGQLVQSHFQPHMSLSTHWGDTAWTLQPSSTLPIRQPAAGQWVMATGTMTLSPAPVALPLPLIHCTCSSSQMWHRQPSPATLF